MKKIRTGIIIGSLRKASWSRKLGAAAASLLPAEFEPIMIETGNLALYNQDFDDENRPPAEWVRFREEVQSLDAVLFVTPEYNRSIPPALKNALDVASRPFGQNRWNGKPGAVISLSIGKLGGFGANHHLRQALVFLNVLLMQQPEMYIGEIASLMDDSGTIANAGAKEFLELFARAYTGWVKKILEKQN